MIRVQLAAANLPHDPKLNFNPRDLAGIVRTAAYRHREHDAISRHSYSDAAKRPPVSRGSHSASARTGFKSRKIELFNAMRYPSLSDQFKAGFKFADDGDCWPWEKAVGHNGYGLLHRDGRTFRAHRLSWEVFVGPIGDGMVICHRCDNRNCVNPRHLFAATQKDNIRDALSKGRMPQIRGPRPYQLRPRVTTARTE